MTSNSPAKQGASINPVDLDPLSVHHSSIQSDSASRVRAHLAAAGAVLLGLAVPGMALGRAAMGTFAIAAVLLMMPTLLDRHSRARLRGIHRDPLVRGAGLVLVFALATAPLAPDPADSATTALRTALLAAIGLGLWAMLSTHRELRTLTARSMAVGSAAVAIYILTSYHIAEAVIWPIAAFASPQFSVGHAFKAYGSVIACLVPVLWLVGRVERGSVRWIPVAAIVLTLAALPGDLRQVPLSGVSGLLGAVALTAMLFLVRAWPMKAILALFGIGLAMAAVAFIALTSELAVAVERGTYDTVLPTALVDAHRQIIWGYTGLLISQSPWLGYGVAAVDLLPGSSDPIPGIGSELIPGHPHNFLLELFVDLGVPAALGLCALVLALFAHFAHAAIASRPAGWAGVALFGAFWTASLSNFSIWTFWWLSVLAILTAFAASHLSDEHKGSG